MALIQALIDLLASLFGGAADAAAALPVAVAASPRTLAVDLAPLSVGGRIAVVRKVIASQLFADVDEDIPFLMADMENGIAEGLLTSTFQRTNSLYNRHKGSARGDWNGKTYTITNKRGEIEELRCYDSLEQSVRDFVQLMQDPLYRDAWTAWQDGDLAGYIAAVNKAGYSTQPNYAGALAQRAHSLGVA